MFFDITPGNISKVYFSHIMSITSRQTGGACSEGVRGSSEKPLRQSKPPSNPFDGGICFLCPSNYGQPFFVDSVQGTHCAFGCTFVPSGRFPVVSEILVKADNARPYHRYRGKVPWSIVCVRSPGRCSARSAGSECLGRVGSAGASWFLLSVTGASLALQKPSK